MHRTTLGDFELTVVSDGTYLLDGGAFFGVVPKTMWSKKVTPDEQNRLAAGLNSLLVRTGKKNILIETGIGNKLPNRLAQIFKQPAQLLDNLHAAGVAPEEIDIVINTHLHFDHCGWNTVRRGDRVVATFPNAKYYVQKQEWEHGRLQLERDAISYLGPNYDPLLETGQMVLLNGDQELLPGISVKVFPGHTANMQAVIIESGGGYSEKKKACYISDLIPTSNHLDLTWVMAFDLFPLETIESRKKYYAQAIPERWLTVFTHDDQTPWGYVERGDRDGWLLRNCEWALQPITTDLWRIDMSYQATVYKVMIASPGDVEAERAVVREILSEWNTVNSDKRQVVLLAIGWETHSAPEMGDRPQAIINKRVLRDCDLLVGVFWTRIGTATGGYPSGTVEEIEEHLKLGKPAMLYFSDAPVAPQTLDPKQYDLLREFKESCKSRGILETYSTLTEFKSKFYRQLQIKLNQDGYFGIGQTQAAVTIAQPRQAGVLSLSREAQALLLECADDPAGTIMRLRYIGGTMIQSSRKAFVEPDNPRSVAVWEGALEELESNGLVSSSGGDEVFRLTRKGYELADLLRGSNRSM